MRLVAAFVFSALFLVACTKKDRNAIPVDSPLLFTYDQSLSTGEIIAKVDGEEIAVSQLFGPSPALQEIEERMNKIVLSLVYEKALADAEKGEVQITFGFAAPKEELKDLVHEKFNKSITVTFDETAVKGHGGRIGERTWTREELAGQDMLLSRLMSDSFQQKIKILEGVISRRKILQASKDANSTMEDYIQNSIMKGVPEPTEAELATFAKNNNIYESDLTPEMKLQVLDTIKARKRDQLMAEYVAKNLIKTPIKVGFKKAQLRMDGLQINPDMVPSIGTGPIEILLFTNTQCESCQELVQTMSSFAANNGKYFVVKYVFNFPDGNGDERMLAEASLCLRKQNDSYFWQFPSIFTKGETPIEEAINNAARNSGADYEKFRSCFLAREFKDTVEAHLAGTKTLGFHRPPVAVVNGLVHEKPVAHELIDEALGIKAEKGLGFNLIYKLKKMFAGN
jgi:protein-disulfide isomerase